MLTDFTRKEARVLEFRGKSLPGLEIGPSISALQCLQPARCWHPLQNGMANRASHGYRVPAMDKLDSNCSKSHVRNLSMGQERVSKEPHADDLLSPLGPPSSSRFPFSSCCTSTKLPLRSTYSECRSPTFSMWLSGSPWPCCFGLCSASSTGPMPHP